VLGLFFVGPEKLYFQLLAELADSFRAKLPSPVLPSGEPEVLPLGSVIQRLIPTPVGSPETPTT